MMQEDIMVHEAVAHRPKAPTQIKNTTEVLRSTEEASGSKPFAAAERNPSIQDHVYRVRGIPLEFDEERFRDLVSTRLQLEIRPEIRSYAEATDGRTIVATFSIQKIPAMLPTSNKNEWSFDITEAFNKLQVENKINRFTRQKRILTIDDHFRGFTVLSSPPATDHKVDCIAIGGLGGHAFGSFKERGGPHMWLCDRLPHDLLTTRIMIYGYESKLNDSDSFQDLDALGTSLRTSVGSIKRRSRGTVEGRKPLFFIAHSLGGLVVKQVNDTNGQAKHIAHSYKAIIQLSQALPDKPDILNSIYGALFFGVPNQGMNIEAVMRMVENQVNEKLVHSLSNNSLILRQQSRDFDAAFAFAPSESKIMCFYETKTSATAIKKDDKWVMKGPKVILVNQLSAIHGRGWENQVHRAQAINRDHSELVKFGANDEAYDSILTILEDFVEGAVKMKRKSTLVAEEITEKKNCSPKSTVPFERDEEFIGRSDVLTEVETKLSRPNSHNRAVLAGLGGVGKSQIAIEYSYRLRDKDPNSWVFWIHASTAARFEQEYKSIASILALPGWDQPQADVLNMVLQWLSDEGNGRWLVILDNLDDIDVFLSDLNNESQAADTYQTSIKRSSLIPQTRTGSVLITTRDRGVGSWLGNGYKSLIKIDPMNTDDAMKLLETRLLPEQSTDTRLNELVKELEYIPLAIAQAGAYIAAGEPRMTVSKYLSLYRQGENMQTQLLDEESGDLRRDAASNSVIRTWQISFDQIKTRNPQAAELLSLMAMLDRQGIPESLICNEGLGFENALSLLTKFSLITVEKSNESFEMHRLVQLATRKWLMVHSETEQHQEKAIILLSQTFPIGEYENWKLCETLLPHVTEVLAAQVRSQSSILARARLLYNMAVFNKCRGLYEVALHQCHQSLSFYREDSMDNDVDLLKTRQLLGDILSANGQVKEAEELQLQELETTKRVLGQEHPDTLISMNNLALTYSKQGRFDEAEELELQELETTKRVLGQEHPDTLISMNNLALTYLKQGRFDEAEELELQVLEMRKRVLGQEHPSTLMSMNNLAFTYLNQGRFNEAEELELQVLETRKRVLGQEHPDTLMSMNNLASTYLKQGRFDEAEELQLQVLKMKKRVLGQEHPDTLISMNNLASTYSNQGRFDEAEELQLQVLETRKRVLGQEHPSTLTSMNNLASTYSNQGRFDEAEELQLQVLETRKRVLGQEHPDTLISMNNLASTYSNQGRFDEAEELQLQVLETRKRVLGQEHPSTLTSMNNLALTYSKQGRFDEAEELELQVLKTTKRVLGQEHPSTLTSMNNLASTYSDQGRFDEAEELQLQVLEMRKRVLGQEHPDTFMSMNHLALTYSKQGRFDEAEELQLQVLEMRKRVLGQEHPDTLISMNNLACTWKSQSRDLEAITLMKECLELRRKKLGENHPDTQDSIGWLEIWLAQPESE